MDLTMTAAERWTFMRDVPRVAVLSIAAGERGPVASPIWFTADDDGSLAFSVAPDSRKATLLAAEGRATLCVQNETAPYQYVTVEGPVELRGPTTDEFRRAEAIRYLGEELGEIYFAGVRDDAAVTFALRPQRWSSIDYNKLFAA
jgi:hypothetical protein